MAELRTQLLDDEGNYVSQVPGLRPADLCIDKDDNVYIGEIDGRITVMGLGCNIKAEIGYPFSTIRAHSVWLDRKGDIYFCTLDRGTCLYKLLRLE